MKDEENKHRGGLNMKQIINRNNIKSFLDVARYGGFKNAGRVTGKDPGALHRAVKSLEFEAGTKLCTSVNQRFFLTRAGQRWYETARHLEAESQHIAAGQSYTPHNPLDPARVLNLGAATARKMRVIDRALLQIGKRGGDVEEGVV